MFLRLCGPPSIPLSFTVAGVLPRWNTYRFRFASDNISPKASIHRLLCGLPGYLILFDPRTFVHERHLRLGQLPTQSGFFVISMHFTATRRIPPTSTAIKPGSINGNSRAERGDFTADLHFRLRTL